MENPKTEVLFLAKEDVDRLITWEMVVEAVEAAFCSDGLGQLLTPAKEIMPMGGDNAPKAAVDGAIAALQDFSDIEIVLTGDEQAVKPLLGGQGYDAGRLTVVHTAEVIEMNDAPVKAIKEKKDSSMVRAMDLLSKDPRAMMISAGNTGALVAGSTLLVKRIPGIKRPALASVLPAAKGEVLLIDGGANVDCRPAYLQQFGIMGSIFMSKVFGLEKPRVGLINNGGEEEKGSELTKVQGV